MRKRFGVFSWLKGEWVFLFGLALLIVFGVGLVRETVRRRSIGQEIASLKRETQQLTDRQKELQGLINYFQDASTQEREARTKLNLVKPGEKSLLVQTPSTTTPGEQSADQTTAPQTPTSNLTKWWNYFFGA